MNFKKIVKTEKETELLAEELLPILKGKVVLLNGTLGAGKTTFVKYLAKSMGFPDDISSPTFSIANNYKSPTGEMIHFDLYRIESEEELEMTGFYDMVNVKNITAVVEWAEKFHIEPYLKNCITMKIDIIDDDGAREFTIS